MNNQLFEAALGIAKPWYVQGVDFDAAKKTLTIIIDFVAGSRFAHAETAGSHPVHDTQVKRYRHLNFFQHECYLEVRTPRVKLPDGRVVLVEPDWAGKLSGFTLGNAEQEAANRGDEFKSRRNGDGSGIFIG